MATATKNKISKDKTKWPAKPYSLGQWDDGKLSADFAGGSIRFAASRAKELLEETKRIGTQIRQGGVMLRISEAESEQFIVLLTQYIQGTAESYVTLKGMAKEQKRAAPTRKALTVNQMIDAANGTAPVKKRAAPTRKARSIIQIARDAWLADA